MATQPVTQPDGSILQPAGYGYRAYVLTSLPTDLASSLDADANVKGDGSYTPLFGPAVTQLSSDGLISKIQAAGGTVSINFDTSDASLLTQTKAHISVEFGGMEGDFAGFEKAMTDLGIGFREETAADLNTNIFGTTILVPIPRDQALYNIYLASGGNRGSKHRRRQHRPNLFPSRHAWRFGHKPL